MSSLPWNNVSQMSMSFYFSNDQTNIQLSSYWRYKYMPLCLIGYFVSKAPEKLQMQKKILTSLLFMEEGNFIYMVLPLWQEEKKYTLHQKRGARLNRNLWRKISVNWSLLFYNYHLYPKLFFFLNVFTTCYLSSNLSWQCSVLFVFTLFSIDVPCTY